MSGLAGQPLEYRELWPGADLRGAWEAERARRIAAGWRVEDIPHYCSFCFADRDDNGRGRRSAGSEVWGDGPP
jgi:hypothetical protein